MIKIDLITGFLGSGKTTFIKKYARYLMDRGCHIGILENDYGAVNVDMMLLQELRGAHCELEMVAGGCDADCHKRRFRTKLISMGMSGYDRVLIEPSGIFDVDEFFDALYEEPLCRWYEIGNVIAIVDAGLEEHLSRQSEFLLASQTANAGAVILSRSQEVSAEEIAGTVAHLNRAMEQFGCGRRFGNEIISKAWETLTIQDMEGIASCGYRTESYVKLAPEQDGAYSALYFMNVRMTEQELREKAKQLMNDAACGHIFRIKGFMVNEHGQWIELNAAHGNISIKPIENGQEILIVIGEELQEEAIKTYWT